MRAASLGNAADGLLKTLPAEGQELLAKIAGSAMAGMAPATPIEATSTPPGGNGAHPPGAASAAAEKPAAPIARS
jgi:hypothetical protein